MRSISRLAVTAAALLVGATALVASEESVRLARVIEKPEDLATVFADAQTSVTYDSATGRFYYPSLGLYFDPVTSLFYDPKTGKYRDQALQGEYYEDYMSGMFYDSISCLYYDTKKKMSYNPASGAYSDLESGLSLYWDSQLRMFYDPMHDGKYYDRGLGVYLTYDQQKEMFRTEDGKYYDPELGLYYDEHFGLFYDPLQNRYYDRETGEYRDPDTGSITPDAAGHLHFDAATGYYFCDRDGHYYWFDSSMGLYCSIDAPMDGSRLYYDADTTHHIVRYFWSDNYYELESGNLYDPISRFLFDSSTGIYYRYDVLLRNYVDTYTGTPITPHSSDGRKICERSSYETIEHLVKWGFSYNQESDSFYRTGDILNYEYDPSIGLLLCDGYNMSLYMNSYDTYYLIPELGSYLRYDEISGVYYELEHGDSYDPASKCFYDETFCVFYRYDENNKCFVNAHTGLPFNPNWMNNAELNVPSPLSSLQVATVMSQYDLTVPGMYYMCMFDVYTDGAYYFYDKTVDVTLFYDSTTGFYYDINNGSTYQVISNVREQFDPYVDMSSMYWDDMYQMYYDWSKGCYYDDKVGLYYDGMSYFNPQTWDSYWYDSTSNRYINSMTGEFWVPKKSLSGSGSNGVDMSNMYWDDMYQMYYDWSKGYYYDDKVGLYYDGMSYYDPQNWDSYWYDSMMNRYVNYMTGATWVPSASTSTNNGVDMSNMYWDDMYQMYYDWSKGYYYDDKAGLYYDGMNYYDPQTWDSYWYDSMTNQYINWMTGEAWTLKSSSGAGNAKGFNLANMVYDDMYDMYYDPSKGYYFDATVSLYYDGMSCYYDPQTWRMYYYDSMQDFFYDPMTGERYVPRDAVTGLTQDEIDEIKNEFHLLGELMPYANMEDPWDMMADPINKTVSLEGTYYVAPFGAADAVWFDRLLGDGMNCQSKRIRLRASAIPLQLEVEVSDPWTMMPDMFQPANLFIEVSESVWNRATRSVVLTLEPAWCMGGLWNGNSMYYWTMTPMTGIEGVDSQADFAAYARYAGDGYYENLFSMAVFRGCWSFDCSGMGMMMGGSECGLPVSSLRTIGGLQDTDGDGLADVDEYRQGTNPFMYDTDGDGLNDALELRIGSCPTMYDPDSDGDGMADVWEKHFNFNPQNPVDANADPDCDGLINRDECYHGTNPIDDDTDADGLRDGQELKVGTQPCNPDTDNDGLPDGIEVRLETNPLNPDTDLDGVLDGAEIGAGLDPLEVDTDDDGVSDRDSLFYQNAKELDSIMARLRNWLPLDVDIESDQDGDGWLDYVEAMAGSSPYDDSDTPVRVDGVERVIEVRVTLNQELPHAVLLDLDGAQVCLRRPCTVTRWVPQGVVHKLRLIGRQGMPIPISVDFGPSKVVVSDPDSVRQGGMQPTAVYATESTARETEFYQIGVAFSPNHICFHGSQKLKTVVCSMKPFDDAMVRPIWVLGDARGEVEETLRLDGTKELYLLGRFWGDYAVNVPKELVGLKLFCLFLNGEDEIVCADGIDIESCWRRCEDCDGEWCELHNCEHNLCACDDEPAKMDAWCELHGCHVANCPMLNNIAVPTWPASDGDGLDALVGSGDSDTIREDGEPYFTKNASKSVALNDDDDDGNGEIDTKDSIVEDSANGLGEDNFRAFVPFPCDRLCCHCDEHAGLAKAELVSHPKLEVYTTTDKKPIGDNPWPMHLFAEGRELSSAPGDAKVVWNLNVKDEDPTAFTNEFAVYSLRLVPDLTDCNMSKDVVDTQDEKLIKDLRQLKELGVCLRPGERRKVKLMCNVLMPGNVKLEIVERNNCNLSLEGVPGPLLQGTQEKGVWEQEFYVSIPATEKPVSGAYAIVEATYTGSGVAENYECKARLRFSVPVFQIAGDGNRDGKINFNSRADKNLTFWVNGDYDLIKYNEEMYQEDDTNQGLISPVSHTLSRNCDDDIIGSVYGRTGENFIEDGDKQKHYCFRDLEDFDRIQLKIDPKICALKGKGHALELKCQLIADDASRKPSINLFKAERNDLFFVQDTVDTSNMNSAEKKIAGRNAMIRQMDQSCLVRIVPNSNPDQWQTVPETTKFIIDKSTCFLYEGCSVGKGKLNVRICSGDLVLGQVSLNLALHSARDFTEIYKIDGDLLNDATGVDELNVNVKEVQTTPSCVKMPGRNNKEMTLLVLGWNVDPIEKDAWNDTFFKRLFWHGYKGRAGSFMWPCLYGQVTTFDVATDPPHFDRSEHRAWLSAPKAAAKFAEIVKDGTHLTLVAHSQGNILVGEALRRLTPEEKGRITYIAMQGAISAQMYTTSRQAPREDPYGDGRYNLKVDSLKVKALIKGGIARNKRRWGIGTYGNISTLIGIRAKDECESPDLFGHYPTGLETDKPYLDNALVGLRNKANFYNRKDYALEIWIGNHSTRPDNLAGTRNDDCSFGYKVGSVYAVDGTGKDVEVNLGDQKRFYQNRNGRKYVIYPGDDSSAKGNEYRFLELDRNGKLSELKRNVGGEAAKWCIFSFVVQTRSLAIGQVDMGEVFGDKETTPADEKRNINLETAYGFSNHHYYHSYEFRSNSSDTWSLWNSILKQIQK